MTQATGQTFRVFVSSTFSDLKAERDALQAHVFPRLRELCEKHGARFQAIDRSLGIRDRGPGRLALATEEADNVR